MQIVLRVVLTLYVTSQRIEAHVIRLHLGIMKLFTNRREEGMNEMIAILTGKGDRLFSALLRDLPLPERARLSEESHRHGIALLQKGRDPGSVQRAVHCFSIAILLCRETDLVLEGKSSLSPLLSPFICGIMLRTFF